MSIKSFLPEPVFAKHLMRLNQDDHGIILSSGFLQQIRGDKQKILINVLRHLNLEELIFQHAEDAQILVLDDHFGDQVWLVKTVSKENQVILVMLSSEL